MRTFVEPKSRLHARFALFDDDFYIGSADLKRTSFDGNIDLGLFGSKDSPSLLRDVENGFSTLWESTDPVVESPKLSARAQENLAWYVGSMMIHSFRIKEWLRSFHSATP